MAKTPEEKAVAAEAKKAAKASGADKVNEIQVNWVVNDSKRSRVYSRELHGDRVVAYAEEFAKKVGGTCKKLA